MSAKSTDLAGYGPVRTAVGQADRIRFGPISPLHSALIVQSIEDLAPGHEDRAATGQRQQLAPEPRILAHIDSAPFGRAQRQRVDDQKRFELRLDDEKILDPFHGDSSGIFPRR